MVERAAISISALAAMIQAVQNRSAGDMAGMGRGRMEPVRTAWGAVPRGTLHEWFAAAPPGVLMIDLARAAVQQRKGTVFWIGRACWPYAAALSCLSHGLLEGSVFVDVSARQPGQPGVRAWAIDLVLRSSATAAVVADGRELDTAQSRRLQLAAEAGGALALLWRKEEELRTLSVAHYRWRVTPAPTAAPYPRWRIERLRCKDAVAGRQGTSEHDLPGLSGGLSGGLMMVEHHGTQGLIAVPAELGDRSREAALAARVGRRSA
ncbi:MAG: hypothetical protein WD042_01705 [Phycisphaeraceae bacterium]